MRTSSSAESPEPGARRGPPPPQQARSRAMLEKVLASAEELLGRGDEPTMAGVAEHAGVSVGALYRRFDGKDQLVEAVRVRILDRLETDLADSLAGRTPDLADIVDTYVEAVVRNIAGPGNVFRRFVAQAGAGPDAGDRVVSTLAVLQRLLLDAAAPHFAEIRRPDPATALAVAARLVLGACIQRVLVVRHSPDGLTWQRWSSELADMVLLYLANPGPSRERPVRRGGDPGDPREPRG